MLVREKGTGKELPNATLYLRTSARWCTSTPRRAPNARSPRAPTWSWCARPATAQEERIERLHAGERLERTYFIEKERLNEYETIVHAPPPRAETGVVTLQAEEIHTIPGTFGDPFRAAMLLPGVGSVVSGLGYPIIRGEAPGQTGTFIDDVKVPLLYHLGFGPAVVHPLYLESLDFHPGNFPAEFGRFTGGLIRAKTDRPRPTSARPCWRRTCSSSSAFHAQPFTRRRARRRRLGGRALRHVRFLARALRSERGAVVLGLPDARRPAHGDGRAAPADLRRQRLGPGRRRSTGRRARTSPSPSRSCASGFNRARPALPLRSGAGA